MPKQIATATTEEAKEENSIKEREIKLQKA